MLELLLSILALFGLSPDKSGKPISINAEIYSKIGPNANYHDLGVMLFTVHCRIRRPEYERGHYCYGWGDPLACK